MGQAIDAWFARHNVRPQIVGRIDDSALLKGFAQRGYGVVAVPTAIEAEVLHQYALAVVGRTAEIRQDIFLIRARTRRPHSLIAELEADHSIG
jgi:LysR family transcriptional activator of nhaA